MKKKVIIVADGLEIGGIERSLISMLDKFDYDNYEVDLMLYQKKGELLSDLDKRVNLLEPQEGCKTFGVPVRMLIKQGKILFSIGRILANIATKFISKIKNIEELGYYQTQLMYNFTHIFLKKENKKYDIAIGYVWPHNYAIEKVDAKVKIGWIHTDYSTITINRKIDEKMWSRLDYIVSISNDCTKAFEKVYPRLKKKIILVENITSPKFILNKSKEEIGINIDKRYFNILSVGRICHQKGFDIAVKVLNKIHLAGYKDIKWNIVGFGPDEEKVRDLIKEYKLEDSFILHGKKINPYPYMAECDLYVQPSRYEGKAVTINEAKVLGKPIIITNYETAESQIDNMVDGIITELNIDKIADSIINLYKNKELRISLEKNCRNKSYENSKELLKLYEVMNF